LEISVKILKYLVLVAFVIYLAFMLARWYFQYWTGQACFWLGLKVRNWIPAEMAHNLALWMVRWTYWRPDFSRFFGDET
jgi:hypothetical protein